MSRRFRIVLPVYYVVLAVISLVAFGSGAIIGDGQAELHIDPLRFVKSLWYAWDPVQFLGRHTGFSHVYEMPYSWLYALFQMLHVGPELSQRLVMFALYLAIVWAMHFCLRSFDQRLPLPAVAAGSTLYLLNPYVAFNSQGSIPMLLSYAALPVIAGVAVSVCKGALSLTNGCLAIGAIAIAEGGVNPPLLAINFIVLGILAVSLWLGANDRRETAIRLGKLALFGGISAIAISAYWLLPFLDYMRTAWVGGILIEPTSMQNADSSFVNVFRGLGQWAIFAADGDHAYYPWADAYRGGLFAVLLWVPPIIGMLPFIARRRPRWQTLFFLATAVISIPLVVGYYHDDFGLSVTAPLYDILYRHVPGFQMFRSVYKWVSAYEFGLSGLVAYACVEAALFIRKGAMMSERVAGFVPWVIAVAVVAAYLPILAAKANYPMLPLPSWQRAETALAGDDPNYRVAVFPTQYLEAFSWGQPAYSIESSLIRRPQLIGYLGDAPQPGADHWIKAAYRLTRLGAPEARALFSRLNADTLIERDDQIPTIDFSIQDQPVSNSVALTHDEISYVLRGRFVKREGELLKYRLSNPVPLLYAVEDPRLSSDPASDLVDVGDPERYASGATVISPADWAALGGLVPDVRLPSSNSEIADAAVDIAQATGDVVHASAGVLRLNSAGAYRIVAFSVPGFIGDFESPRLVMLDGHALRALPFGFYSDFGSLRLLGGLHAVRFQPNCDSCVLEAIPAATFDAGVSKIKGLGATAADQLLHVYARRASTYLSRGDYRISATPMLPTDRFEKLFNQNVKQIGIGDVPVLSGGPLPFVPLDGTRVTTYSSYPNDWYDGNTEFNDIAGASGGTWMLIKKSGAIGVFVAGTHPRTVMFQLYVSAQSAMSSASVRVGDTVASLGKAQDFGMRGRFSSPYPVRVSAKLPLQPGWNRVTLRFQPLVEQNGASFFDAGIAPAIRIISGPVLPHVGRVLVDSRLATYPLPGPPQDGRGDPHLVGAATQVDGARIWIASEFFCGALHEYRVYAAGPGDFDIDLLGGAKLPVEPCSEERAFVIVQRRGRYPGRFAQYFSGLAYSYAPLSTGAAGRLLVDGKAIGASVRLASGDHEFRFEDSNVRIRNLRIVSADVPAPRRFDVHWVRRSPVALKVDGAPPGTVLVFSESYHPEWQASCGAITLHHVIVDGFANGWVVPPSCGRRTIDLVFRAQEVYTLGIVISLLACGVILTLSLYSRRQASRAAA